MMTGENQKHTVVCNIYLKSINMNKINTTSETTITNTIEKGQFIINGNGRVFILSDLTEDQVELTPWNPDPGKEGRILSLPRKTFCQLFHRRNYNQVNSLEGATTEHIQGEITGSNRFMVK